MMLLYVKGDSSQAINAATMRGLTVVGVTPSKGWPDIQRVYVRPDSAVYAWHGEGPGKGIELPPGTLLWFKHCD